MENDDRFGVCLAYRLDEPVMRVGEPHMLSVAALVLHAVGQADEQNRLFRGFCRFYRFGKLFGGRFAGFAIVGFGVGNVEPLSAGISERAGYLGFDDV